MSSHIVLQSPSVVNRRQPLLQSQSTSSSSRIAEVAGGTTAECAAVCCCCPCGLVNLLVLAIYKVPAGLCRRAMKEKRKQQLIKKGLLPRRPSKCKCGCDDMGLQIHPVVSVENSLIDIKPDESEKKVMELEKEMWQRFYSTGFWRSSSQRESIRWEQKL